MCCVASKRRSASLGNVTHGNAAGWRREWPLPLAVVTLTTVILGKGVIAGYLESPVALIALLTVLCAVILAAAVASD